MLICLLALYGGMLWRLLASLLAFVVGSYECRVVFLGVLALMDVLDCIVQ